MTSSDPTTLKFRTNSETHRTRTLEINNSAETRLERAAIGSRLKAGLARPLGRLSIDVATRRRRLDQVSPLLTHKELHVSKTSELTMKELFDRWTELKVKRVALDVDTRTEGIEQSDLVRRELCTEPTELLEFIESMGMSLQDHYQHVRFVCRKPMQ